MELIMANFPDAKADSIRGFPFDSPAQNILYRRARPLVTPLSDPGIFRYDGLAPCRPGFQWRWQTRPYHLINSDGKTPVGGAFGNGDGGFGAPAESDACPSVDFYFGAVAELNGDHKPDHAVPNDESLSICLGNGDGAFASPANYFFDTGPNSVVVADFNMRINPVAKKLLPLPK